jgi:hypothetical protein
MDPTSRRRKLAVASTGCTVVGPAAGTSGTPINNKTRLQRLSVTSVDMLSMLPTMAGYLKKKSSKGLWQLRYFVTNNSYLNYYLSGEIANTSPTSLQASFDLRRVGEIEISTQNERIISLVMFQEPPATSTGTVDPKAKQQQSTYQLKADTAELALEWVKALTLRRDCCSMLTPLQWACIDESERQMNVNDRLNKLFERGQSEGTAADALQGAIAATAHLQHLLYQISQQRSNGGCSKGLMVDMIRTHFLPYHSRLMMELMYIQDLNQHGEGGLTSTELLQAMVWLSLYSRCAQQAQMLTQGASTAQEMVAQSLASPREKGSPINAKSLLSDFPSMKRLCKAYTKRLSFELQQLLKRALRQAQYHIVTDDERADSDDSGDGVGASTNPFAASAPTVAVSTEKNNSKNASASAVDGSPTSVAGIFYVTIRHTQTITQEGTGSSSSTSSELGSTAPTLSGTNGGDGVRKVAVASGLQSMGRSASMPTGLSLNPSISTASTESNTITSDEPAAQGKDDAAGVPNVKRTVPIVYQCSCGTAPASHLRRAIRRSVSQAVNAEREARTNAVSRATVAVESVFDGTHSSGREGGDSSSNTTDGARRRIPGMVGEGRSGIPLLALICLQCCMCAVNGYYKAIGMLIRRRARDVGTHAVKGVAQEERQWQELQKLLCCILNDADTDGKEVGKLYRKAIKLAPSSAAIARVAGGALGIVQANDGENSHGPVADSSRSTIHSLMKRACQSKLCSVQCTLSLVMRATVAMLGRQLLSDSACMECLKSQLFRQEWLDGPSANKGLSIIESGVITAVQSRLMTCLNILPHPTYCALIHYSFDIIIVAYCSAVFNAAGFSTARRAKLGMDGPRITLGSKTSSMGRIIGAGGAAGGMGAKSRSMGAMTSMLQAYREGKNSPQSATQGSLSQVPRRVVETACERATEGEETIGAGGGKIAELESEECEAVMLNDAESLSECFKDLLEESITVSARAAAAAVAAASHKDISNGQGSISGSSDKEGRALPRRPSATRLLKALARSRSNSFSSIGSPIGSYRGLKEGMTPSPSADPTTPRSWEQRRQQELEEQRSQEQMESEKATEEEGSDGSDDDEETKIGTAGLFAEARGGDGESSGGTPKKKKKKLRLKKKAKRMFRRLSGINMKEDVKKAQENVSKEGGESEGGVCGQAGGEVGAGTEENGSRGNPFGDGKGDAGDGGSGGGGNPFGDSWSDGRGSAGGGPENPLDKEGERVDNEGSDGEEEDDEADDRDEEGLFVNDESSADESSDDEDEDDSSSDDDEAVVVIDAVDVGTGAATNNTMSLDDWLGGSSKTKDSSKGSDSDDYNLDMDDRASEGELAKSSASGVESSASGIESHLANNPFGRQQPSVSAPASALTATIAASTNAGCDGTAKAAEAEAAAAEASAWQSSILKDVSVGGVDVWQEFEDSDDDDGNDHLLDEGDEQFAAAALSPKLRHCGEWEVYLQKEWAQARARRKTWQPLIPTSATAHDSASGATAAASAANQRRNSLPSRQELEQREVRLDEFAEQEQDLEDIRDLLGNSMFDIAFRHVCDRHPGHEHQVFAALDAITQLRRDLTSAKRQEVLGSCLKILQEEYLKTCGLGHTPIARGIRKAGAVKPERRDLFDELFPNAPPHPWEKAFFGRSLVTAVAAGGGNGDGGGNVGSRFNMFRRRPK